MQWKAQILKQDLWECLWSCRSLAQGHWSCRTIHWNSFLYSFTYEKTWVAVHFTRWWLLFCQFVDRNVVDLMSKYSLFSWDANQVSIFFCIRFSIVQIYPPNYLLHMGVMLKLVNAIFIKFLFFHQMMALQKLWKMFFISSKSSFLSQDLFLSLCLFFFFSFCTSNHMFRREIWEKFTEFIFLKIWNKGDFKISKKERGNFINVNL